MNNAINELVRSIVKKNSLAECSVSELQRLTTQYPYFGPVQFLLVRKLKEENAEQFAKQSQKAILYFQDDLWFDYVTSSRLNDLVFSNGTEQAEIAQPVNPVQSVIDPLTGNETVQTYPEPVETIVEPVEEKIVQEEENAVEPVNKPEEITFQEEVKPINDGAEEIDQPENEITVEPVSEPEEITSQEEEKPINDSEEEITTTVEDRSEPVQVPVHEKAPVEYDDAVSSSVLPEMKVNELQVEQPVEPMGSEDLAGEEEETPAITDLPPLPGLKIEPFNPETAKLSFEPYHTVDYFASQGIKFREEDKPKDRFGQQLKSFTDWLKTLKKTPETDTAVSATGTEDKKVTQMAQHSLVEKEVVTEAMADVWEKQGNHAKAIDTYRKLSLLNPSKSAYFAAKIEHLKQL